MTIRGGMAHAVCLTMALAGAAQAQTAGSAKIEAIPLELLAPDAYQIASILEPIRHVAIAAPFDGILRALEVPVGASVRDRQEIAQLDRTEAAARVKIAKANVREIEALLKNPPQSSSVAIVHAQLEAAQARLELAELELDRCTLLAPFSGRILEVAVSPGQFVPKGAKIAELADVSSLRALVPFDRTRVAVGAAVTVSVEGRDVSGKVQATVPLPETLAALHDLSTAFTAAWVIVPNTKNEFEPGQRVLSPSLPTAPIATVPARAVREPQKGDPGGPSIQIIRNEYVTGIPVRILGHPGPERVQISALLRPTDSLIVSSSVPLQQGTLIRFSDGSRRGVEGTNPNPAEGGEVAGITLPRNAASRAPARPATRGSTPQPGTSSNVKAPPF